MNKLSKISITALRVGIGSLFLWSGVSKYLEDFSAEGYLNFAAKGPFKDIFVSMAGSPMVDFLVVYGEIGIGIAIILGLFTRFASYCGILMMLLFYISKIPQENGPISNHIIYALVFLHLAVIGAGRYWGLDKRLEKTEFVKKHSIFKWLLA